MLPRLAICFLLIGVAACGFKPVYAQHDSSELSKIYVEKIPAREGQVLRNTLQDMLSANGRDYNLSIALKKESRGFGIQEDLRVSRYDVVLTASYTLINALTGSETLKGTEKVYSSYNRTESEFSTFVAEEDATEKAAQELALRIRNRLVAHFD